ncbi:MAG: hypothetical protein ACSHXF_09965 [Aquaticitalea sp.]
MKGYKIILAFPLLTLIFINSSVEISAQNASTDTDKVEIGQNILKYVITKDTKDKQLDFIKEKMANQEVSIVYKELNRNDRKEIIGIAIEYDSKKGSGEFFVNSSDPINDIAITLNVHENKVTIAQAMKNLSQSFEVKTKNDGSKALQTEDNGNNVFVYTTDDEDDNDETVTVVGKDGENHAVKKQKNTYVFKSDTVKSSNEADDVVFVKKNKNDTVWIKQDVKNIVWTDDDGKDVEIIAVEKGNNMRIFNSNGTQPLMLLDGKEISSSEMSNLKSSEIKNVIVLKGDEAVKKYGEKGKNDVIYITTKDDASLHGANETIAIGAETIETKKETDSKNDLNSWSISTEVQVEEGSYVSDTVKSYNTAIITKNTNDKMLTVHKTQLKSEGVTFDYSKLKRNTKGEIIKIKVELSNGNGQSKSGTFTNDDGISQISMGIKDGNLFIDSSDN